MNIQGNNKNIILNLFFKIYKHFIPTLKKILFIAKNYNNIRDYDRKRKLFLQKNKKKNSNLILFLFPNNIFNISGGVFSILNMAAMSRDILNKQYNILVCYTTKTRGFSKYIYYPNNEIIYKFKVIMRYYPEPTSLTIFIPEFLSDKLFTDTSSKEYKYITSAKYLHINILNQNFNMMPSPDKLSHLFTCTSHISQTTAHANYCTLRNSKKWNMPLRHLGAVFEKDYPFSSYGQKKNIIAYSPDINTASQYVISKLKKILPRFTFIMISGISYTDYLEIISNSKYVISFGEGADGYFYEPFYCGSIGCAIFNNLFFHPNQKNYFSIYKNYDELITKFPLMVNFYNKKPIQYDIDSKRIRDILPSTKQSWNSFIARLDAFYEGNYNFMPHGCITRRLY